MKDMRQECIEFADWCADVLYDYQNEKFKVLDLKRGQWYHPIKKAAISTDEAYEIFRQMFNKPINDKI